MKKWIDLLNSMGIDFEEYNNHYIDIYGYGLNTVKFEMFIAKECVEHNSWEAQGQEIYRMKDGTEITILL